jgi:hypothetical protein
MISGATTTGNVGSSRQRVDMSPRSRKVKKEKQRRKKQTIKLGLQNFSI